MRYNWLNSFNKEYESFVKICSKQTKNNKANDVIFKLFSNGISTGKYEWLYEFNKGNLKNKMQYFITKYNNKRIEFGNLDKQTKYYYKDKNHMNEFRDIS